jgi:hypothetical protein
MIKAYPTITPGETKPCLIIEEHFLLVPIGDVVAGDVW